MLRQQVNFSRHSISSSIGLPGSCHFEMNTIQDSEHLFLIDYGRECFRASLLPEPIAGLSFLDFFFQHVVMIFLITG